MKRHKDIDAALAGWPYKPDVVQARVVPAADGRDVVQMRLDLGVMQLETTGRPDGTKPHGYPTYLDYLRAKATAAELAGKEFALDEEQGREADREFMQFYHRRICWLALGEYGRAVTDADHTLAFMDFVRDHAPTEEFAAAHEQYRGFVLFHRTQAEAAARAEDDDPEGAVDALLAGEQTIGAALAEADPEFDPESDPMLAQLRRLADEIRKRHGVRETLQEQLRRAVAAEDFEKAAELRDQIRRRTAGADGA
jgi:hypothetical protein